MKKNEQAIQKLINEKYKSEDNFGGAILGLIFLLSIFFIIYSGFIKNIYLMVSSGFICYLLVRYVK